MYPDFKVHVAIIRDDVVAKADSRLKRVGGNLKLAKRVPRGCLQSGDFSVATLPPTLSDTWCIAITPHTALAPAKI